MTNLFRSSFVKFAGLAAVVAALAFAFGACRMM